MKRRRQESGFALLLVFLMAAIIAISLYMEIPRIAFESQRQKEQLLVERGEQYKRAIQVFYTTNKRYPARIEELESLNNRRFLRRRYIDPMTGKEQWRLVHIQNGMLTDSVDSKQKKTDDKQQQTGNSGQYVAEVGGLAQAPSTPGQGGVNLANRRRASEGGTGTSTPGMPGSTADGTSNAAAPGVPGAPVPPGIPGIPGVPGSAGMPGQPGSTPGGQPNPVTGAPPSQSGSSNTGSSNTANNGSIGGGSYVGGGYGIGSQPTTASGTQGAPTGGRQPINSQFGSLSGAALTPGGPSTMPPGTQQPGMNPQAQNAAAAMIQQILTQPRPGGMPTAAQGGAIGGGIAGVASNADDDSIMVYHDHTNYGDWEFIFDYSKYRTPPNPLQGGQGTPASQLGNMPGGQVGTPVGQQPGASPFGQTPGTPGAPGTPGTAGPGPGIPR